jgi:hypothetical protein
MHLLREDSKSLRVIKDILDSDDLIESASLIKEATIPFSCTTFYRSKLEWCLHILLIVLHDSNCFDHFPFDSERFVIAFLKSPSGLGIDSKSSKEMYLIESSGPLFSKSGLSYVRALSGES